MSPDNAPRRTRITTEDVAELVRIKGELERRLQKQAAEVAALRKRLTSISNLLEQLGAQPAKSGAHGNLGPLRTVVRDRWGNPIANIDVESDLIRITPSGPTPIDTRRAPFRSFFVRRVLERMQDEDQQGIRQRGICRADALTFQCREDRGMLIELVVWHYRTSQRLERIKNALNWALEKQQVKRPLTT